MKELLAKHDQTQLLRFYDVLDEAGKNKLLSGIESIDWTFESALKDGGAAMQKKDINPIDGLKIADIAKRRAYFEELGVKAIQEGKVAAVLLAGGMGTRLGVDGPKGCYNIGETRDLYIFEQQMENLKEVDIL